MAAQGVDAQRGTEVVLLAPGEELDHVAQIVELVVDGRRREHEDLLGAVGGVDQVGKAPVAGGAVLLRSLRPRIAEVVGLVNNDDVGQLLDPCQPGRIVAAAIEVGMIVDGQVAVVATAEAADVRKTGTEFAFPDVLARSFGHEQEDALAVVHDKPLDEHQADVSLAEADGIAEEGTTEAAADVEQVAVARSLVAVENRPHARAAVVRPGLFPLLTGHGVAAEQFVQGLGVALEGRGLADVALDRLQDLRRDVFGLFPVSLKPVLQDGHFVADLDVEFDVLGDARKRQVAGADQGDRPDDGLLAVGDVGFGVELLPGVDAALDLARAQGFDDSRNAVQEVVAFLLLLDTLVELLRGATSQRFAEGPASAGRHVAAHEDSDLVQLLPLAVEAQ